MVDIWLDAVTPKDSLLVYSLLPSLKTKGYKTLVTAKKQTQTTELLDLLEIDYTQVGTYGGSLEEKLKTEQERTLEFIELFDRSGLPKVLWTHGDVSAIRTAFGLKIPIVYANDTLHAYHVAKLVCPLVNWLIAPIAFGKSWSKFGISRSRIMHYDGIEEIAWIKTKFSSPKFLDELKEKKPVILFRNVEYKAAYCKDVKVDTWKLLKKLSEFATVVYLPRYEEEKEKISDFNIWMPPNTVLVPQLIPYIDLAVGSGGTICRETTLMGIPTINFHFWDTPARYLFKKGFPIQRIDNTEKILKTSKKILKTAMSQKRKTAEILGKLENPMPTMIKYIEKCFNRIG